MNILILHSEDGQDWVRAVLYPDTWTADDADEKAVEVFAAVQNALGDDWTWEEYEPALVQAGFVIPFWHHGPTWDRVRVSHGR